MRAHTSTPHTDAHANMRTDPRALKYSQAGASFSVPVSLCEEQVACLRTAVHLAPVLCHQTSARQTTDRVASGPASAR